MEIKERILNHASTLFMRNGIKSVSMDDIAASMAMSKKTLYKWFENKDQIVLATMEQHLHKVQGECEAMAGHSTNAVEQMVRITAWAEQQFTGVHPSIFYDLQKYYPAAWQLLAAHKNTYVLAQITQNLRRGMTEGFYRPDLDVDVLARLHLSQIDLTFDHDVYPPAQFEAQRVRRVFDEHFLLGVATLKGHKLINKYRHVTEEE
ncbi:TetR family transcriptional regulator [Hymenobacter sedentarius]|uniref:TetR family transcriptional regulator n=1 Tax=Hymenobacter sedentarius TaxID=1411621 RepID=A0A0U4AKY7_9BACT|nr:TetR/AcrR family transcriptional regulator [Hymenobacter sedentarius]ALW84256.1 TetR family transcriptional regulator [Hymenobacter sedentarius]